MNSIAEVSVDPTRRSSVADGQQLELVDQIELTEGLIDDLEMTVATLIARLDPVVNHTLTPNSADVSECERAKLAPLAERISRSNERIRAASSSLQYTLRVLQV